MALDVYDASDETTSYYLETGDTVGNSIAIPTSSGELIYADFELDSSGQAEVPIALSQFGGASFIEDPNDRAGVFVAQDNDTSIVVEAEIGALADGMMIRVIYI